MSASSRSLTRPPGYAPRGTAFGVASFVLLSTGVPITAAMGLIPVLEQGLTVWIDTMPAWVIVSMLMILPIAFGLYKRRYWFIVYWFWSSVALLVGYVLGLLFSLAVYFRLLPLRHPEHHSVSITALVFWVLLAPFAFGLLRLVRLRYWQPWTVPESWEPGDETTPSWAPEWASILTPEQRAEVKAKYGDPRQKAKPTPGATDAARTRRKHH